MYQQGGKILPHQWENSTSRVGFYFVKQGGYMDQEKIGKFIFEMRKQKGMTQKELAEKVGISDKTISKWECGNSMPDISYLEKLCNSLDISINELLSGQRLSNESYSQKAEENIMALMKENESNKREGIGKMVIGMVLGFLSIATLLVTSEGMAGLGSFHNFFDSVGVIAFTFLSVACVLLSGKKTKEDKLKVLQKTAIPSGVLLAMVQFILMWRRLDSLAAVGPNVAVATLVIIYGITSYLIVTILLERTKE